MSINRDLMRACSDGELDEVKALLKQGADIHAYDDDGLRWAAWGGHLDVARYLVEQGADIHARGDYTLRWAAHWGRLDVVNYLREAAGTKYKCHECLIKSTCLELCEDFRAGSK